MMKWGRKKTFHTSSSSTSSRSKNVTLKTWMLRFKKVKDDPESESRNDRFHNSNERCNENEDNLYTSDYRLNVSPVSSTSFKKTVSNVATIGDFMSKETRFKTIKMETLKEQKSRKGEVGSTEEVKKIVVEDKHGIIIQETSQCCVNPNSKSTVNNSSSQRIKLDSSLEEECKKIKNMKISEIMLKNEKQRKRDDASKETHRKRSKQGCKVNSYPPRIKAIEDMKRLKMKMNKEKEIKDAFKTYLDSFAIIKSSYDPQWDFRDSMIEMIIENGIEKREELEELLACYLILNCDEYHGLIIKVFQEVWLELNQFENFL